MQVTGHVNRSGNLLWDDAIVVEGHAEPVLPPVHRRPSATAWRALVAV